MTESSDPPRRARRLRILLLAICLLLVASLARLAEWQVVRHDELQALIPQNSDQAQTRNTRGMILDRNGYPLAMDVWGYQLYASPSGMGDEANRRRIAEQLALLMKKPNSWAWDKLSNPKLNYVPLDYQASLQLGDAIRARNIQGIGMQATPLRTYPAGPLAAQTIGFVNLSNQGLYGVEEVYHKQLNGETDECQAQDDDVRPAPIQLGVRAFQPTPHACDVVLTLDWAIQDVIERELAAGIERTHSTGGTAIVIEPATGRILGMASQPTFDLNKYSESSDSVFTNPAISLDYEPGSVVKIMTMAAGLDSGIFSPQSAMVDSGEIIVGGFKIHNWDNKGHGRVTMVDILAQSLNVGAAYISTSIGQNRFYDYADRFGIAQRTGVDLANEVSGQMRRPNMPTWHPSDLGTNSFGQGMTMTPLQVAMMAGAIANGGVLMRPYVVDALVTNGRLSYTRPQAVRRVVSTDTAHTLSSMLAEAVEKESVPAMLPTVRIAGKTGTASIPDPRTGKYDPTFTIASFVGWAPYDNPKFVVLVKLDKPQTTEFGSLAAAPVFREIAKKLVVILDMGAVEPIASH